MTVSTDPRKTGVPAFGGTVGRKIVLLGDSFENMCGPGTSGVITSYPQEGYFGYANALLNGFFRLVNAPDAGVGGQTCAQIAARVHSDALAYNPDWVLVGGGTNNDLSTDVLVSAAYGAIKFAWDAVLDAGKRLIVCTRPARDSASAAQLAGVCAYNAQVRAYARESGAVLFDMAAAVSNPGTGYILQYGEYGAEADYVAADGAHLSFTGASVAGYALYTALLPYVQGGSSWGVTAGGTTSVDLIYDSTNGVFEAGNLFANGKMLGTSGTLRAPFSATALASGWEIATGASVPATGGTGAVTKVASSGPLHRGEWQQIQIAPGATTEVGRIEIFRESVVTTFDGSQGLSIGDSIYGSMRFETDESNYAGSDGLSSTTLSFAIQCLDAAFATLATSTAFNRAATNGYFRMPSGVITIPPIVIPANTAHIFAYIRADGVGTFRVTDIQGRKVV